MADMKFINDLPEQTEAPDDAEVFVIQGNGTKKIPWGKIKEYVGSGMPVVEITMEEYKKLSAEEKNMEVFYLITDLDSFDASNIAYSGNVAATNVKDAIDEVYGMRIKSMNANITTDQYSVGQVSISTGVIFNVVSRGSAYAVFPYQNPQYGNIMSFRAYSVGGGSPSWTPNTSVPVVVYYI